MRLAISQRKLQRLISEVKEMGEKFFSLVNPATIFRHVQLDRVSSTFDLISLKSVALSRIFHYPSSVALLLKSKNSTELFKRIRKTS